MKNRKLGWIDEFHYLVALQIPLILVTGIDYIVHNWLYKWGLQFDYSWAYPYWILLSLVFISLGIVGATAYSIDRKRYFKKTQKIKLFAVAVTIMAEYFGGFLDTLWFSMHAIAGQGINWTQNWRWSLFSVIFGHWNLQMNIVLNIITGLLLMILWYKVKDK